MKRWSGGTLIGILTVLLFLRYSYLFQPRIVITAPQMLQKQKKQQQYTFWNPNPSLNFTPKPHLLHNLTGLVELYSLPLSSSRSTLLWPHIRDLLSRSDSLPDTATGIREASVAWKQLAQAIDRANASDVDFDHRRCPFSVTGNRTLEVPCGLVQDSAVTVVGLPRGGNESSGFQIEMISGSRDDDEGLQRSVILRYRVRLDRDFIDQNAKSVDKGWGVEETCPSSIFNASLHSSSGNHRVDGLVTCSEQATRGKGSNGGGSGSSDILGTNFPFVKEHVFTATLWAGLEGFHMNVNGKHETSFTYRERLEPWLVNEVKVSGDLDVLSSIVNGLPVTEDWKTMFGSVEDLRAPPVVDVTAANGNSKKRKKRRLLLIGVFSTAGNFERRMAIRRSWMQYKAVRSGQVAVRFFTGLHKSSEVNLELWNEAETYEDIQLMPFVDYYSLISLKTIGICIFGTEILAAKYIMKTDDDAFVRIDEIVSILKNFDENGLLYGSISFDSEPHRDQESKWYISPEEWMRSSYPPWAHGPGYIISRDIAKFVVNGHQRRNLRLFKLEDVAMGIWVSEFKNSGQWVRYVNDDRFHSDSCGDGYVVAHYQGPRLMLCLWKKIQSLEQDDVPMCCV